MINLVRFCFGKKNSKRRERTIINWTLIVNERQCKHSQFTMSNLKKNKAAVKKKKRIIYKLISIYSYVIACKLRYCIIVLTKWQLVQRRKKILCAVNNCCNYSTKPCIESRSHCLNNYHLTDKLSLELTCAKFFI